MSVENLSHSLLAELRARYGDPVGEVGAGVRDAAWQTVLSVPRCAVRCGTTGRPRSLEGWRLRPGDPGQQSERALPIGDGSHRPPGHVAGIPARRPVARRDLRDR